MIKYFLSLLVCCVLISCSVEEVSQTSEKQQVDIKASAAMRSTFEVIKENSTKTKSSNKSMTPEELCFQFVYPITLEYTTSETVVVADYGRLLQILLDETFEKHINGIGFPFEVEVRSTASTQTISNEEDFKSLINTCGYDTIDYTKVVEFVGQCFTLNYPVSLIVNDQIIDFSTEKEATDYFIANYSTVKTVVVNYPLMITLIATETTQTIKDDYEFIYLVKDTCGFN